MHCPRCGTNATVGQQLFCRRCGFNLERVSDLVGEQFATEQSSAGSDVARLKERQRKLEVWRGIAGLTTLGLILVTLVFLAILRLILSGGVSVVELFLTLIVIAAAVMVGLRAYSKFLTERLENPSLPRPTGPPRSDETRKLEMYREPVPTVTDRTTELLVPVRGAETGEMDD